MSKFTYASAPVHPFTDVEVCERVMQIPRAELCKHPNPKLKIGVIEDNTQMSLKYLLDFAAGIKRSLEEGRRHVIILGAPNPQYALLAQIINQLNISCKHVHTFNMDEYADENGNTAPADHPGGFQYWMWRDLFNRIKPELAIPPAQIHFPSTANVQHYSTMIEDMGGADICYGGCGWNGHIAFFEPHVGAKFGDDMEAFMREGSQIVDIHPLTIAQNSLQCDGGASGAWHRVPPKAATIGPRDLVNSKVNGCYHFFAYGDVSWQRFITRLMIHGPVTPKVPGSIYQVIGANMWLSGTVAADLSTRNISERRVAYADIRDEWPRVKTRRERKQKVHRMAQRKNVLIVGTGSIGLRHLRCFQKTSRVRLSICEVNPTLRSQVAQEYGIERQYADLEAALADRPDAAVIATPAHLHVPLALRLAEAGVHLLLEKPLSTSMEGVDALRQIIASRGLSAAVAYVYRAHPALGAMKEAIASGRFGRPVEVVATSGQDFPFCRPAYRETYYRDRATGGGAIQDALTHILNAAEWLAGPIDRLAADAAHQLLAGVAVEDTVHLLTRHGPVLGCYCLNQYQAPNETSITVVCERGTARFAYHENRWRWMTRPDEPWHDELQEPLERDTLFVRQANRFLDYLEGRAEAACSLAEGIQTLRVNLAALASAEQGTWQTITPEPGRSN